MMTPTQREAYLRQQRFRAAIAAKAAQLRPASATNGTAQRNTVEKAATGRPAHEADRARAMAEIGNGGEGADNAADELAWFIEICGHSSAVATKASAKSIPVAVIQEAVARSFNVSVRDILSARRTANVVLPRQLAMYLARHLTRRSLPDIGRCFGDRDHTTVIHAVRKVDRLAVTDSALAARIDRLRRELT